jgi:hypothetical protein
MVTLLSVALFVSAPQAAPFFLDPDVDVGERLVLEHEDPAARPSLSRVRRLLDERRAGQEVASLGPISLAGFSFARELQVSSAVRVIVVSCFLGGGLLAFDSRGKMLAAFRTWQILDVGLASLGDGDTFALVTRQEDVRGSGVNVVQHNVYRVGAHRIQRLWQGLDHGHSSGWGATDEDWEGYFRFWETGSGPPRIRQVLRDLERGKEYVRTWTLRGDRYRLVSQPPQ